jgi:lipoprotein NlpI
VDQDNLPEALKSYQASLAIFDHLTKSDVGNAAWQRSLSVSYEKVGNVQDYQGNLPEALISYQASLAIRNRLAKSDPSNAGWQRDLSIAYYKVGNVQQAQGNLPEALKFYNEAVRLDPKNRSFYYDRGLANLYTGALPDARADLNQARSLNPKDAYAALWLDIVDTRSNLPSGLPQAIAQIDMATWPGPVIQLFLGHLTPAGILAAADDPDATKKEGQVCEANFYSGELALREGAKDEAVRLFRLAADDCPKDFREWFAANQELNALGVGP